jgi:hypothetical protein
LESICQLLSILVSELSRWRFGGSGMGLLSIYVGFCRFMSASVDFGESAVDFGGRFWADFCGSGVAW